MYDDRPAPLILPTWLSTIIAHFLIAATWVGVYWLSGVLEFAPHASLWYPPAAVTFAAVALLGWRAIPALLVGCIGATYLSDIRYQSGQSVTEILVISTLYCATHVGAYYGLVAYLRHISGLFGQSAVLRLSLNFLIFGAVAATLAGILGTLMLSALGLINSDAAISETIVPWLIGDFAGLVSLSPVLLVAFAWVLDKLALAHDRQLMTFDVLGQSGQPLSRFGFKLSLLLASVATVMTGSKLLPGQDPVIYILFFTVIMQNWIVHTEGAWRSVCSLAAVSFEVVLLTYWLDLDQHALLLQFAMLTLAVSTYFGVAVPMLLMDNQRLRQKLTQDSLTRAASRQHFIEVSRKNIKRALKYDRSLSIVMVDMDFLKRINDNLGHQAGDRALARLVRRLKKRLKSNQLVGRLGGDEFGILLPDTGLDQALSLAEELQHSVENTPADKEGRFRFSASFGVAELDSSGETLSELLGRADAALYDAKRAGRNRVAMN